MAERKSTKWVPVLWQRRYRGVTIWVEEVYATGLRWEWNEEGGGGGRSPSRVAARDAAESAIDKAHAAPHKSISEGGK